MATLVDGIDVASAGELKVALDAGADAREISFAGPGKREAELRQAVASRVLVNIESMREVALLDAISHELGLPARVAVRVNPDFELKGSGMKMGGGPKPFGVDAEQVPDVLARIGTQRSGVRGISSVRRLAEPARRRDLRGAAEVVRPCASPGRDAPAPVRFLNLGGGFGIPYFPGEQRLDLAPIGANLDSPRATRTRPSCPKRRW